MAYDERIAERIRILLREKRPQIAERKMFGGLCLMTNGNMFAGVTDDGLMLRVGAGRYEEALSRPEVRPMDMGGRLMNGYVLVGPHGLETDEALGQWLEFALTFVETLPAKEPGVKKRPRKKSGRSSS